MQTIFFLLYRRWAKPCEFNCVYTKSHGKQIVRKSIVYCWKFCRRTIASVDKRRIVRPLLAKQYQSRFSIYFRRNLLLLSPSNAPIVCVPVYISCSYTIVHLESSNAEMMSVSDRNVVENGQKAFFQLKT